MAFVFDAVLQDDLFASSSAPVSTVVANVFDDRVPPASGSSSADPSTGPSHQHVVSTSTTATASSQLSVDATRKRKHLTTNLDGVDERITKKSKAEERLFRDVYTWDGTFLGSGAFGDVLPCVHRQTGDRVAVKLVKRASTGSSSLRRVLQEINCAYLFSSSPAIIDIVEYFQEQDCFYTVYKRMEGGDLSTFLREHGRLSLFEASKVCGDVALALLEMHMCGIAHRDVKPANILCEREGRVFPARLADFDLASEIPSDQKSRTEPQKMFYPCGTDYYLSPEMVQCFVGEHEASYTVKTDIWSLGVTLYRMVFGKRPFTRGCYAHRWDPHHRCRDCKDALYHQIETGNWSFPDDCDFVVSDAAKDLISRMLVIDPNQRMSARDVLIHPFVSEPEFVAGPGSPSGSP